MKKNARVAIITRTKDRLTMLERALTSVKNQTFDDYIHVILNDGGNSKDLNALLNRIPDSRRVVIHNKVSAGITPALNQAIQSVESEYVTILDDDDSWHKNKLAIVDSFFEQNPTTEAAVVRMDIVVEDIESGKIVRKEQYLHPDSGDGEISLYKQCTRNYISNGIVTYTRSLYEKLGGYDESLRTAEDWDFGIRVLMQTDVGLVRSKDSLFFYHQRPEVKGVEGNSVHAEVAEQERTINIIRNKYLRDDIKSGRLGVGYIMNATEFDIRNVSRLEGHVNYVEGRIIEKIEGHIDYRVNKIHDRKPVQIIKNKIKKILR